MSRELIAVIDQIGREKGIDKAKVIGAVEAALQTAAKKRFGQSENIQVQIDQKTGEISVVSLKTIVDTVTNPKSEISIQEARRVDSEAEVGDEIGAVIEMDELGRIAAQTAKQVICQKVREAEWEAVQREYATRTGDLINGIILGQERRNYLVDLGKTEAVLPAQEQIPAKPIGEETGSRRTCSRCGGPPRTCRWSSRGRTPTSWPSSSSWRSLRSPKRSWKSKGSSGSPEIGPRSPSRRGTRPSIQLGPAWASRVRACRRS